MSILCRVTLPRRRFSPCFGRQLLETTLIKQFTLKLQFIRYFICTFRPIGTMVFRNPQALGSAFPLLGTLQPRAFGFLNTVVPLVSVSLFCSPIVFNNAGYFLPRSLNLKNYQNNMRSFRSCIILCVILKLELVTDCLVLQIAGNA